MRLKQQDPDRVTRLNAVFQSGLLTKTRTMTVPVPAAGGQAHVPRHFPVHIAGEVGHSAQYRALALGTPGFDSLLAKEAAIRKYTEALTLRM